MANGTQINVQKTITPYYTRTITYQWDITKTVTPSSFVFNSVGDSAVFTYTITVTRSVKSVVNSVHAEGQITVSNQGKEATENLAITDRIETNKPGPGWNAIAAVNVDVSSQPVLAPNKEPGDTGVYSYSIDFTPLPEEPGLQYRNVADVTITNQVGHLGETSHTTDTLPFNLPEPVIVEIDETATVTDVADSCPAGYSCVTSGTIPNGTQISDSTTFTYTRTITRTDSPTPAPSVSYLNNTATVTADDSGASKSDTAQVLLQTSIPQSGAVLTASKTATGTITTTNTYTWDIGKSVTPKEITLARGASAILSYTIEVNRTLETTVSNEVSGTITITNTGPQDALNLTVVDKVYLGTTEVGSKDLIPAPGETLAAGATRNIPYSLSVNAPVSGLTYTNKAIISISNPSPGTTPPTPTADFVFSNNEVNIGETATVTEVETCPPGFSCQITGGTEPNNTSVQNSTVFNFEKTVTNISATPGTTAFLTDTATVVPSEGAPDSDSESVTIHVPGRLPQNRGYNIPEITPLG